MDNLTLILFILALLAALAVQHAIMRRKRADTTTTPPEPPPAATVVAAQAVEVDPVTYEPVDAPPVYILATPTGDRPTGPLGELPDDLGWLDSLLASERNPDLDTGPLPDLPDTTPPDRFTVSRFTMRDLLPVHEPETSEGVAYLWACEYLRNHPDCSLVDLAVKTSNQYIGLDVDRVVRCAWLDCKEVWGDDGDLPDDPAPEPYYHPAQLELDRPVQLEAVMPDALPEPEPEPADNQDTQIPRLPCALIVPGDNDRTQFEPVALAELAEDIAANGLAQPITVRPMYKCPSCANVGALRGNRCRSCVGLLPQDDSATFFQIVAGERRFRAISQVLQWPDAPVIIRGMTDAEAAAVMLSENLKRVDLNPIDEARAYQKRMADFGWSQSECAAKAGVPPSRVRQRLGLLQLIPDAQLLVQSGNLGMGYAECMVDLDANRQATALRYFQEAKKPNLADYKALCGELLVEQAQDVMFDIDSFMVERNQEDELAEVRPRLRRFPVNDTLPAMPKAKTAGLAIETYIMQLLSSGELAQQEAAAVVGTVYEGLLKSGFARRPAESPLDALPSEDAPTVAQPVLVPGPGPTEPQIPAGAPVHEYDPRCHFCDAMLTHDAGEHWESVARMAVLVERPELAGVDPYSPDVAEAVATWLQDNAALVEGAATQPALVAA